MPSFVDSDTGGSHGAEDVDKFALMATGLLHTGVMFAKTYFERTDAGSAATVHISQLAAALLKRVQWATLLCDDDGLLDPSGTNIPMTVNSTNGCGALMPLQQDGYYNFNEEHHTVDFAYHAACPSGEPCANSAISAMWRRWQARRLHPDDSYQGFELLSMWSSYLVQLPYYMVHTFNSDPVYQRLFKSHCELSLPIYR